MKRQTLRIFLTALALAGLAVVCGLMFSMNPSHAQTDDTKQSEAALSTCPKCKGTMEPGIVRDYWAENGFEPALWSPANEKLHLFSKGTKVKITAYRCTNCGYIESYAK